MRKGFAVLLVAGCVAFAPFHGLAAEYDQIIEKFMAMIKAGQTEEAVDFLYGSNPWMSRKSDAVQNVRSRLSSINQMVGTLKNHERLQELTAGTRFVYVSYLAAYERQPIRFEFEFYKPTDTWMVFSFSFDDKLDDDIEEQAKRRLIQ